MYGVSVFPGTGIGADESLKYMERAAEKGMRYLFTSILEAVSDRSDWELTDILEKAKSLGMTVIVEVSRADLDRYEWADYGELIFRIDCGFTDEEIVELSKKHKIQLNAGRVDGKRLEELVKLGLSIKDTSAGYDCYPRRDTGMAIELLRERNQAFKGYGMSIMAFIGSQNKKRGPLCEGMPTIEAHRGLNVLVGAQELQSEGCDVVFIGDSMASGKELVALAEIRDGEWLLPARGYPMSLEEKRIFEGSHLERMDQGEYVVRSSIPCKEENMEEIPQGISSERGMGSITIDNCGYGRYQGELQIVKRDLPADERVNVVGRVEDRGRLVQRIKPGDKFRLYKINR